MLFVHLLGPVSKHRENYQRKYQEKTKQSEEWNHATHSLNLKTNRVQTVIIIR